MGVLGTFGTYSSAILGIHVAQTAMQVTGNNIGNINTTGYTRQRVDQCSIYNTGIPRYQNSYNQNIGYGAIVDDVSQLRDPYLDIRYRNDNSSLGYYESMQEGIGQIAHILDEVGRGEDDFGMIEAKMGEMKDALRDLLQFPDSAQHDNLVNAAASTLCRLFNSAAKELQEVHNNEEDRMMEEVKDVNEILYNIRDLNEQIRTHSIYDDNALELRDARNVQIDKLSKYMKLNVVYSMEKLDSGKEIEKLTISLYDTEDPYTGKPYVLVDGVYATQLLTPESTPKLNTAYEEDWDTSKMYWDMQTKKPTHDIREARRWNTAYNKDAKQYLIPGTDPPQETDSVAHMDTSVDPATRIEHNFNPSYFKYIVDDPQYQADDDVVQIGNTFYTNNQNKAGILYNDEKNNNDEKSRFNAGAITSYKYIAADSDATRAAVNQHNYTQPDFDVIEAGNTGVYYTNLWNDGQEPSYAIPVDNFKEGSNDNLYLFTLDALKNKKDFILNEGTDLESKPAELGDNDVFGSLQALRELLTEEGEFSSAEDLTRDPNAATKRGIRFYQHMLDSYAQQFAKIFNDNNQIAAGKLNEVYKTNGDNFETEAGTTVMYEDSTGAQSSLSYNRMKELYTKIMDPKGGADAANPYYPGYPEDEDAYAQYLSDMQEYQRGMDALRKDGVLNDVYDYYDGGVLFSNSGNTDDPTGITAANISVSHSWSVGAVRVLNSTEPKPQKTNDDLSKDDVDSKTYNENIAHLMSLMDQKLDYFANDTVHDALSNNGAPYFTGTFQEMFGEGPALLGRDGQATNALYSNFNITTMSLDNDRLSVSGVDLNEEATDMMKYSQAFSAACQLLTTIDSMLDRLINNTI